MKREKEILEALDTEHDVAPVDCLKQLMEMSQASQDLLIDLLQGQVIFEYDHWHKIQQDRR